MLRVPAALETTGLLMFLWLPLTNSYEGFDNFPVVMAAAAFFAAMALGRWVSIESLRPIHWAMLLAIAWLMVLFRAEYVLFVPLYFALALLFRQFFGQAPRVTAREAAAAGTVCLGVALGALSVAAFHRAESGQFHLVPPEYSCWTFLDGTPAAWLQPGDDSETRRVARGIEHFGHPEQYGYSLRKIILANPGATARKFLLNLPRWLHQLGRRHVVAPLPLAVLALAALAIRTTGFARYAPGQSPLGTLAATILMTCPLALLIVYAEYMTPAYGALCVLAADGLLQLLALIPSRGLPLAANNLRRLGGAAVFLMCATMELLLFRGGGTLADVSDQREIAVAVDRQWAEESGPPPVLLDPYSYVLDCDCRGRIVNRLLYRAEDRWEYGFDPMDPLAAAASPAAMSVGLERAVLWSEEKVGSDVMEKRLALWRAGGFRVERVTRFESSDDRRWAVYFLKRE
jgi:hypothetical protein